jgi:hypothetical protein
MHLATGVKSQAKLLHCNEYQSEDKTRKVSYLASRIIQLGQVNPIIRRVHNQVVRKHTAASQ